MRGQSFDTVKELIDKYIGLESDEPYKIDYRCRNLINNLHTQVRKDGYSYYAASAYAGRKNAEKLEKEYLRTKLFRARILLENKIGRTLDCLISNGMLKVEDLFRHPLFGSSKKQGVSFRLGLTSCTPTKKCAKFCYAHDGRERSSNTTQAPLHIATTASSRSGTSTACRPICYPSTPASRRPRRCQRRSTSLP